MVTTADDERGVFPDEAEEDMKYRLQKIWDDLRLPFDEQTEIHFREIGGKQCPYINPRAARRRLNRVLGEGNWDNKVQLCPPFTVAQSLTIRLPDGSTVFRSAVGEGSNLKNADSDAFKRVCVMIGVGEYLYGDDEEYEAPRIEDVEPEPEREREPRRDERNHRRNGDESQRRPDRTQAPREKCDWRDDVDQMHGRRNGHSSNGNGNGRNGDYNGRSNGRGDGDRRRGGGGRHDGPPRTGKAFIAWIRGLVETRGQEAEGLEQHMSKWAKKREYPWRFDQWTADEVADGVEEAEAYMSGSN